MKLSSASMLSVVVMLVMGFILGWNARSLLDDKKRPHIALPVDEFVKNDEHHLNQKRHDSILPAPQIPVSHSSASPGIPQSEKASGGIVGTKQNFFALLDTGQYLEAIDIYSKLLEQDIRAAAELKRELMTLMSTLMEEAGGQSFTDLTDAYLSYFYDDIDVLLLLAQFNEKTDFFAEAIAVYQIALEYAYGKEKRQNVKAVFSQFLSRLEQYYAASNDWYGLAQLYAQADAVGLLRVEQQLRLVELYFLAGDIFFARELAGQLRQNSNITARVDRLLEKLDSGGVENSADHLAYQYDGRVRLEKYGNQYVVNLNLGGDTSTRLLIDTGASMTTLSAHAYERIASYSDNQYVGPRMFNTANGLAKGQVFRFNEVTLGSFSLSQVPIAVLNFDMSHSIDGLLGMNVLGKFKFQIEPQESVLLLSPR